MEIHRQQCQQCGSRNARNILVREADAPMTIYVRCLGCGELVARYQLSHYYHHGKGIESFLRSLGSDAGESGRDYLAEFQRTQDQAVRGYEDALRKLQEQGNDV
ncbi:MAG: hypothetical protein DWQ31_17465 [Planctomycetota bacterium]|nr:MAG: hypothetical protein DWQ31_17465 [Planctomycetota bacterium]REJ92141.1 MAG: hypothetical protein DWQ35_13415 [Planctomycetota bacterium]REK28677.1 MAG: hypothetical protein DWQ42_05005 [Planctomycetota bacterium]REK39291.1 MAG: hypothetical protein DWQ46_18585 [Planctomycetota bacterium]